MARSWQIPDANTPEDTRLGIINEACQDGESWNKSQPGFNDWQRSLEILNGQAPKQDVQQFKDYLSGRRLRTNARTAIAGLANIRPMWGYHAPKEFENFAMAWNKTARALYLEGHWGRDIKDWLSFAAATNTGFMRPVYRRGMAGMGEGRIEMLTYGQPCVLPFQMPSSGDYNEAYMVTLLDEIPIFEAHSRFPLFADRLHPTKSQLWYSQEIRGASVANQQKGWAFNPFKPRGNAMPSTMDQYVPIRYTTIIDVSINYSNKTMCMGQLGTSWYYEVPAYGSQIGEVVDEHGQRKPILASEDDARIYPYRRLIISSEKCILYDGPAFNWHGQLDLIPLAIDKWPWAPGGFGMVHDGYGIEKQLNALDSGIMTRVKAQNNIPLGYDLNSVTLKEAEAFDPMEYETNVRIGYDGSEIDGPPFKLMVPFDVYKIYPEQLAFRQALIESLDYTMQMRDIVELSKAKALGKDMEAMEKLLSALGPIVRDIGVEMEVRLATVGHQVGWLIAQYMTAPRMMEYIGADSVPMEVFDYNPNDLYPSHLPDENAHSEEQRRIPSRYSPAQRARWMVKKIRFINIPGSIHQVHQMTNVLTELQFKQRGFMISDYSVMSAANVPNITPPEGNSEQDMYESEQERKLRFAARMEVIKMGLMAEYGMMPPGSPPSGETGAAAAPVSVGPPKPEGRPPTAQVAPHLETKGDGRTTVAESK